MTDPSTKCLLLRISRCLPSFYHSKCQASASNPGKLFSTFSSLLNPPLPSLSVGDFINHFEKKVDDIRSSFTQPTEPTGPTRRLDLFLLSLFLPRVMSGHPTTCPVDPIPSSLLQTIPGDLPLLTSLINSLAASPLSLSPPQETNVRPL